MRVDVLLAVRFLREGRVQTALLVVGTTIGITVVLFLTALVTAVERTMISQTLDVLPHVVVRRPNDRVRSLPVGGDPDASFPQVHEPGQRLRTVDDWPARVRDLEQLPGVVGVSPVAAGPGFVSRGEATRAVTLIGVERERFGGVIAIGTRVKRGAFRVGADEAVVGVDLARDLGVTVGDRVRLVGAGGESQALAIAGVFDMGNVDVNRRWLLTSLQTARSLLDLPGGITGIELRLGDIWQADAVADAIEARTPLTAESWMRTNTQLMVAIQSQRGATLMIRLFVMLAVAMGIASVLVVSVVQKSKQIGILRAMGARRATIVRVFLIEGLLVALAGALIGCGLGTVLALGSEASNRTADGAPMYPIVLAPSLYAASFLVALVTGLASSALPAIRAARLDPAVAIRHE